MSRLAAYLTIIWLFSAHAGFPNIQQAVISPISNAAKDVKNQATNEVQAGLQPIETTITSIGDSLCK